MGEVPGLEPGPTWGQVMSWPSVLARIQHAKPSLPASGMLLPCPAHPHQNLLPRKVEMSPRTRSPRKSGSLSLRDYPPDQL